MIFACTMFNVELIEFKELLRVFVLESNFRTLVAFLKRVFEHLLLGPKKFKGSILAVRFEPI